MRGRVTRLSIERKFTVDLMHLSVRAPTVTEGRRMQLAPLAQAREQSFLHPRWMAIFVKAGAILAQEFPELRRVYLPLPFEHFYEYPVSVVQVLITREHAGEPLHFNLLIKDPAGLAISAIDEFITQAVQMPLEQRKEFRQLRTVARLPRQVRRLLLWLAYSIGRQRSRYFGTLAVTTPPESRIDGWLSVWTGRLSYGRFDLDGSARVTLSVDHRVVDGPTGARALTRLEQILNGPIADELRGGRAVLTQARSGTPATA